MTLEELKSKIHKSNVPERWYSIDDGLKVNAYILYKNYSLWECFYYDEKGERRDFKIFNNDNDAYNYLWGKLEDNLRVFQIPPHNNKN